jgi:hypothetical protein
MTKTIYLLLVIIGLPLGPGYWIYAKLFSGKPAMTLPMTAAGEGSQATAPFRLDAGMQPAGLVFHTQGYFVPRMDENKPPKDDYKATLYKNGSVMQTIPFSLSAGSVANSNPVFNERLVWLGTVDPAEYRLDIKPVNDPVIQLNHAELQVRANVQEPDGRIVSAGLLMLIIGLMALFLA